MKWKMYGKLMRPKHYIKNVLLFVSLFFSGKFFDLSMLGIVGIGAISFCLISSAVYIFNDIHDVDEDRQHEVKRERPIAAGNVAIRDAYVLAVVLLIVAGLINIWLIVHVQCTRTISVGLLGIYFISNLGYSLGLKNIPFIDICLLVVGFLLRVLYGATLIGVGVSSWVYLTVLSISFYLALGKRRNEMKKTNKGTSRKVLKYYTVEFLDRFMYVCLTLSIAFYALWSADANIIAKYGTDKLIWTVPIIIILMMKYSADVESDSFGDPVDVVMQDKSLIALSVLYGIILVGMIYFCPVSR